MLMISICHSYADSDKWCPHFEGKSVCDEKKVKKVCKIRKYVLP